MFVLLVYPITSLKLYTSTFGGPSQGENEKILGGGRFLNKEDYK